MYKNDEYRFLEETVARFRVRQFRVKEYLCSTGHYSSRFNVEVVGKVHRLLYSGFLYRREKPWETPLPVQLNH